MSADANKSALMHGLHEYAMELAAAATALMCRLYADGHGWAVELAADQFEESER